MKKVELKDFIIYCKWCGQDSEVTITDDGKTEIFCANSDCINNSPEYISMEI